MNTLEKDNVKGDDQKIETRNEDKVLPQLTIHTLKEISSKTFMWKLTKGEKFQN